MHHHQHAEGTAQAEQYEPVLGPGVVRIVEKETVFVSESRSRLLKGDPVLTLIKGTLAGVPFEPRLGHGRMYVRCTYVVNRVSTSTLAPNRR